MNLMNPTSTRRMFLKKSVLAVCSMAAVSSSVWPLLVYGDEQEVPDNNHYSIPEKSNMIGQDYQVIASQEDTLIDIARVHKVGYEEILSANPEVSVWVPGKGTAVTIPRRHILPNEARKGIVINVAELRLYYYPEIKPGETPRVETYPIGIGREGFNTPLGITKTTIRLENPAWYPPRSMRQEAAERGDPTPAVVPPGPDNPLGEHAILLDIPGYLIHGTNQPDGIGMRASRGCIRMYPEDIASIFDNVPSGTQVNIIDQPVKVGVSEEGDAYVQVFKTVDSDKVGADELKARLRLELSASEESLAGLDDNRLKALFDQPDDQIVALSALTQAPKEGEAEAASMNIYQMITQMPST